MTLLSDDQRARLGEVFAAQTRAKYKQATEKILSFLDMPPLEIVEPIFGGDHSEKGDAWVKGYRTADGHYYITDASWHQRTWKVPFHRNRRTRNVRRMAKNGGRRLERAARRGKWREFGGMWVFDEVSRISKRDIQRAVRALNRAQYHLPIIQTDPTTDPVWLKWL